MVNTELCITSNGNTTSNLVYGTSTSSFTGTAHLFNTACFGSPTPYDFNINGGNTTLQLYHNQNYATSGSVIDGGILSIVNGQYATATNGSTPTCCQLRLRLRSGALAGKNIRVDLAYTPTTWLQSKRHHPRAERLGRLRSIQLHQFLARWCIKAIRRSGTRAYSSPGPAAQDLPTSRTSCYRRVLLFGDTMGCVTN